MIPSHMMIGNILLLIYRANIVIFDKEDQSAELITPRLAMPQLTTGTALER